MSGGSEKKMVTLESSDGIKFDVEAAAAMMSQTIGDLLIEDGAVAEEKPVFPLHNVNGHILAKVTEYCSKHAGTDAEIRERAAALPGSSSGAADAADYEAQKELEKWDAEFIGDVSWDELLDIIMAANYMNIRPLMDLSCQAAADFIKDKTPEQVRQLFGIENDFTPEEEAELRKENAWAYET